MAIRCFQNVRVSSHLKTILERVSYSVGYQNVVRRQPYQSHMDSKAYFSSKDLRFDRNAKWHLRHNCYSKLTVSLISIYKHYAFDIADPSSLQDACHMNFVINLAHRGVSVAQWLEHRSAESEGLRFDTSWVLRIFLCPTLVTRQKKHLSLL